MSLPRQNLTDARVRKRRKRTIITAEQLEKLEKTFKQEQWPNKLRKERLAFELGSNEQFVSIWFQNKRARVKREEEMAKMQLTDKSFMISETQKNVDDFNTDHEKTIAMTTVSTANDLASMSDDSVSESVTTSEQFEKNGNEEMASEVVVPQSPGADIKPTVSQEDNSAVDVATSEQEMLTSTSSTSSSSIFHASPAPAVTYPIQSKVTNAAAAAAAPPRKAATDSDGKLSLFRAIINMIAVTEGGIVDRTDPEFPTAVNDALYGIYVNRDSRLIYDRFYGLDLVDFD